MNTRGIYFIYLNLFLLCSSKVNAQGSYDWNEHNNAMNSIDWGRAFYGILFLVIIFWIIYKASNRKDKFRSKDKFKNAEKPYKVLGLKPRVKEITHEEFIEFSESKYLQNNVELMKKYHGHKKAIEYKQSEISNKLNIHEYFAKKEFHNSVDKGTIVEFEELSFNFKSLETQGTLEKKYGEVLKITEFTGIVGQDKVVIKLKDGSTCEKLLYSVKKRVYF